MSLLPACNASSLNTLYVFMDKPELSAVWDQTGEVHEWLWSTDKTTSEILFKLKTLHLLSPIEGIHYVGYTRILTEH